MILVTGATGHLGTETIDFLLKKLPANQIAALVRDEAKAKDLKEKGIEIRKGSYQDYDSLVNAFKGIDKVLLISSSDMIDRTGQHTNAIKAAKEAGVKHLIYTSVTIKSDMTSDIRQFMQSHLDTAEYLKKSGLKYTLLNNNLYSDVLPNFLGEKVLENGIFLPAGDGKIPFASRIDMAEAAANVIADKGSEHENKEYNISNLISYSFADIAKFLTELSGKEVAYHNISDQEYIDNLKKFGVPDGFIGFTTSFVKAMKNDDFNLPDNTLEKLIGRKPTDLKDFFKNLYFSK